jgi:hypothetical protein
MPIPFEVRFSFIISSTNLYFYVQIRHRFPEMRGRGRGRGRRGVGRVCLRERHL